MDEVDRRAIDFDEAFAGFAVGYCGGRLCVSNDRFVREILSSCQRFALLQPWSRDVECDLLAERRDDFSVVHFVTGI